MKDDDVVVVPTSFFRRVSSGLSGSGYGRKAVVPERLSRTSPPLSPASSSASSIKPVPEPADKFAEATRLPASLTSGAPSHAQRSAAVVAEAPHAVRADCDVLEQQDYRVDLLLLLAKCAVPALFVAIGGAVAIPGELWLTDGMRMATEELAAGALLVTYAFELTKGYTLHSAADGELSLSLVAWSFLGTIISAQVQAAAQGMWPYGSGDGGGMGDALPFIIGYFVDGVVLAYDTPPPPSDEELLAAEEAVAGAGGDAGGGEPCDGAGYATLKGYRKTSRESNIDPTSRAKRTCCRSCLRRVRPALSVLTFVVSIDNFVSGLGVLPKLDTTVVPAAGYYVAFVVAIFLGGVFTAAVRMIPSEGVQAAWFAFGAFSLLDGGLELATQGLTEFVLIGFMLVWVILLCG